MLLNAKYLWSCNPCFISFSSLVLEYGTKPKGYGIVACHRNCPTVERYNQPPSTWYSSVFSWSCILKISRYPYLQKHWRDIRGITWLLMETLRWKKIQLEFKWSVFREFFH